MTGPSLVKIQPGSRFGDLTVLERTGQKRHGYPVWRCRCSCGEEVFLDSRVLRRGNQKDCGKHGLNPRIHNLSGQTFGKLTVLAFAGMSPDGGALWECQCTCGNRTTVKGASLVSGNTRSCGCLTHPQEVDYTGWQFGDLTVIGPAARKNGVDHWLCRCSCGNEAIVAQNALLSGHKKSCGCLRRRIVRDNLQLVEGTSLTLLRARQDKVIKSNTSGVTGVYQQKKTGRWGAQITFKGKTKYLGSYEKFEDAVAARKQAEEQIHRSFLESYEQNKMIPESI